MNLNYILIIFKPQNKEETSVAVEEKFAPKRVTSRIVFLKVGQIDTRNERYDAEGFIIYKLLILNFFYFNLFFFNLIIFKLI